MFFPINASSCSTKHLHIFFNLFCLFCLQYICRTRVKLYKSSLFIMYPKNFSCLFYSMLVSCDSQHSSAEKQYFWKSLLHLWRDWPTVPAISDRYYIRIQQSSLCFYGNIPGFFFKYLLEFRSQFSVFGCPFGFWHHIFRLRLWYCLNNNFLFYLLDCDVFTSLFTSTAVPFINDHFSFFWYLFYALLFRILC